MLCRDMSLHSAKICVNQKYAYFNMLSLRLMCFLFKKIEIFLKHPKTFLMYICQQCKLFKTNIQTFL